MSAVDWSRMAEAQIGAICPRDASDAVGWRTRRAASRRVFVAGCRWRCGCLLLARTKRSLLGPCVNARFWPRSSELSGVGRGRARRSPGFAVRAGGEQVRCRSPEPIRSSELPAPLGGPSRAGWLREASRGLIEGFVGAENDAPAGRWRNRVMTAGFWRRRMAHEAVVHHVDVEDTLGRAVVLEGDLAADGVGEVLELFVPFSTRKDLWPTRRPLGTRAQ